MKLKKHAKKRIKFKYKRFLKDALLLVLETTILLTLMIGAYSIFSPKEEPLPEKEVIVVTPTDEDKGVTKREPVQGEIEVLTIGNSGLYSALSPLQLWNETGITSFVAGSSKQNMAVSYYMLEEMLKVQNPSLVIIEVSNLYETRGTTDFASNKQEIYNAIYPVFEYSDLYKNYQSVAYQGLGNSFTFRNRAYYKGYYHVTDIVPYTGGYSYMKTNNTKESFSDITKTYLPKALTMLKEKDIPVLLLAIPCAKVWSENRYNAVLDVATQYSVPYLDLNMDTHLIGLDWSTDTRDYGNHLNNKGAKKVTTYLGQYLQKHYNLIDTREYDYMSYWKDSYDEFIRLQ